MGSRILLAAAVGQEIGLIGSSLVGSSRYKIGPFRVQRGLLSGQSIFLVTGGMGAVAMATTLSALMPEVRPDFLLLVGCGGGFWDAGVRPLHMAVASEEIAPQLGVEEFGGAGLPQPVDLLDNRIDLDTEISRQACYVLSQAFRGTPIRYGPFVTVSTITATERTARQYYQTYEAIVENMEGFGAAYACKVFGVPMVEIRCVSNVVGDRNKASWKLRESFKAAQEAALVLLRSGVVP